MVMYGLCGNCMVVIWLMHGSYMVKCMVVI